LNRGTAPANRTVAGMSAAAGDTRGKYVTGVDVANGVITVTYGAESNAAINNETLRLTPYISNDNSVSWRCGGAPVPTGTAGVMTGATDSGGGTLSGATMVKYLPAACRP
jgi:type IV pilus assembly protein PilA